MDGVVLWDHLGRCLVFRECFLLQSDFPLFGLHEASTTSPMGACSVLGHPYIEKLDPNLSPLYNETIIFSALPSFNAIQHVLLLLYTRYHVRQIPMEWFPKLLPSSGRRPPFTGSDLQ